MSPRWRVTHVALTIIGGAGELKNELAVDEHSFRWIAPTSHSNSRDYYLYSVLDEVQKAAWAVTNAAEIVANEPPEADDDDADGLRRVQHQMHADGGALWQRKLIEVLAELICFRQTPDDGYFHDLMLLARLDELLGAQGDLKEFYACESENYALQIARIVKDIEALESSRAIDPGAAWYRSRRIPLSQMTLAPGRLFSSYRAGPAKRSPKRRAPRR